MCDVFTAQDCAGTWSACTAACEPAADRTWTETAAPLFGGLACPAAQDCQAGEGDCVTPTCADVNGDGSAVDAFDCSDEAKELALLPGDIACAGVGSRLPICSMPHVSPWYLR